MRLRGTQQPTGGHCCGAACTSPTAVANFLGVGWICAAVMTKLHLLSDSPGCLRFWLIHEQNPTCDFLKFSPQVNENSASVRQHIHRVYCCWPSAIFNACLDNTSLELMIFVMKSKLFKKEKSAFCCHNISQRRVQIEGVQKWPCAAY